MAVVNMPLFSLGTLWLNENAVIPVCLSDSADGDVAGVPASGIAVLYNREGDSTNQVYTPSGGQFVSKGRGVYALTITSGILNQEGCFCVLVDTVATGNKTFRASGRIERRPDDRILNAPASGFNTTGTIGSKVNAAGNFVEVFCGASYDLAAQTLTFMVFAQINGALALTPTGCRVTVKDDTDTIICDQTSALPNSDGVFKIVATSIVLTAKKAYKIRARATIGGQEYSSGEALQSFN